MAITFRAIVGSFWGFVNIGATLPKNVTKYEREILIAKIKIIKIIILKNSDRKPKISGAIIYNQKIWGFETNLSQFEQAEPVQRTNNKQNTVLYVRFAPKYSAHLFTLTFPLF